MQAFYLGTRIFSGREGLKEAIGESKRIYYGNIGKGRKSLADFFRSES